MISVKHFPASVVLHKTSVRHTSFRNRKLVLNKKSITCAQNEYEFTPQDAIGIIGATIAMLVPLMYASDKLNTAENELRAIEHDVHRLSENVTFENVSSKYQNVHTKFQYASSLKSLEEIEWAPLRDGVQCTLHLWCALLQKLREEVAELRGLMSCSRK